MIEKVKKYEGPRDHLEVKKERSRPLRVLKGRQDAYDYFTVGKKKRGMTVTLR